MIIGYIRVSTEQQSMKNQKHKLLEYAQINKLVIDEFIELEISSKKSQKDRLLDNIFEKLTNGDIFICTELSRLGRNMLEILNLIEKFNELGIKLIFTNQPELSTNKNEALSSLLLAIYGYFAQTEREIISERTKQGLAAARASGKILGRPKGVKNKVRILDPFKEEIKKYLEIGLMQTNILKLINSKLEKDISLTTLRYFISTDTDLKII
ncbi:recombinase family protein [Poseidonibacter antarcticus]|uniref:recombinase family protein n=1 Tax=Poseidonibacter antarcticus TaxID=2478538 RepID=UPI000EF4A191|nr:recombinase family protein [Poseidonibacter antarcticus]